MKKNRKETTGNIPYCYMGPTLGRLPMGEPLTQGTVFSDKAVFGKLKATLREEEYRAVSAMIILVSDIAVCREGLRSGVGLWVQRYRKIEVLFGQRN